MSSLRVSPELSLPVGWATQTAGILAKKGAGKSNAAVVMAEELYDAGVAFVAVDPKGDWYGIRSSADGKGPGLPIPVFGGRHGDIPLEATAGALVADLVNEKGLTCVLDVSEFSKADQRRFLIAFGERLYRARSDEADVVHLFLEEAHEYLPQRVMRDETQVVNTWGRIVKQGRFRGIGCTLISQRSASLNKDVLTQVDSLVVLRTTAPQDRKAVMAWVEEHDFAHELDVDEAMAHPPVAASQPPPPGTFSGKQVCQLAGITYRQLDYWERTGFVRPSAVAARGSGTRRAYSEEDVALVIVVKRCLDAGLSIYRLRDVVPLVRDAIRDGLRWLVVGASEAHAVTEDVADLARVVEECGIATVVDLDSERSPPGG